MKIFITGICGFVGSTIANHLVEISSVFEVFGIDNFVRSGSWLNKKKLEEKGVKVVYGDIRQASDLGVIPKADWVIDAAANPSVLAGVDGRTSSLQLVQHNFQGTLNLLEYCKYHQAGFILLSSSRVYSIPPLASLKMAIYDKAFVPENNQVFPLGIGPLGVSEIYSTDAPISLYGCTKLNSEQLALEYGYTFQFPVWINRCGVMAGAGQFGNPGQGIFAYWVHSYKESQGLKYIGFGGSGYQVRDCLHPRDLVSLLLKQFKEPFDTDKHRTVNVSGGIESSMSLAQLTEWCDNRFVKKKVVQTNTERPFDVPWLVLDSKQAKGIWNWKPELTTTRILDEIALFAESQSEWCQLSG